MLNSKQDLCIQSWKTIFLKIIFRTYESKNKKKYKKNTRLLQVHANFVSLMGCEELDSCSERI